jgi:hypothetical protein
MVRFTLRAATVDGQAHCIVNVQEIVTRGPELCASKRDFYRSIAGPIWQIQVLRVYVIKAKLHKASK